MHTPLRFMISAAVALAALPAWAGLTAFVWPGTWKDARGGIMGVTSNEDALDLYGTDEQSIYRCTCVVEGTDTANCVGEGFNHTMGFRFTYRSRLTLSGDTINESWEAFSRHGTVRGQGSFKRQATKPVPPKR